VIFRYGQIRKVFLIADDQTLLVCQVEKTDEAVRSRDVCHCLLWIDHLQVVDDIRKLQETVLLCLRRGFGCLFWRLFFVSYGVKTSIMSTKILPLPSPNLSRSPLSVVSHLLS